jgi:hypothetical protein
MARRRIGGLSLVCAALLGTTAVVLVGPVQAQSVGVTSATDGDPLGRPPSANERILRIGIDVQANEVVSTRANDRAHLVFLDGTSLTVGPNAQLTVDKFVYDPNSKTGELSITATQGVFRLVGGKISKSAPITINTPSSTIGMRGGIGIFGVSSSRTTAGFLYGFGMRVTGQGRTENVTRPGSQVIINTGAPPGLPTLLPPGALNALISQLEGNSRPGGAGSNADQKAQSSGYSNSNSGQAHNLGNNPPGTGNPPNVNNNTITTAVSNAADQKQPQEEQRQAHQPTEPTGNTKTLKGFVSGLVVASNGGDSTTTRAPVALFSKSGDLTINTNADSRTVTATVLVRGIDGKIFSPTNASLELGTGRGGVSFFRDDQTFLTATIDGIGTLKHRDHTTRIHHTSALISAGALELPQNVRGSSPCTCDFLTFGYWATLITEGRQGNNDERQSGPRLLAVPLGLWVAGQVATELPNTGKASFSGVMLGQAKTGQGAIRDVQGSYGMNYNFQYRGGSFNASFDHKNYAGGVVGTGGANFAGLFASPGHRVGSLSGAFYTGSGAGGGVVGQAGQFSIHGPGYLASGVFGGSVNAGAPAGSGR